MRAVVVRAAAAPEVAQAVGTACAALQNCSGIVIVAANRTDFDLERDDAAGAFGPVPAGVLPRGAATVFAAHAGPAGTGVTGHVDWRGLHPDCGEFHVELAWSLRPRGRVRASARHFHLVPWPGPVRFSRGRDRHQDPDDPEGLAVATSFLRVKHAVRRDHGVPCVYYALHGPAA
jgi:hypothetical protein